MRDLAQEAIEKALDCEWDQAIELNKEILKNDPSDIDALNRLARAYSEKGNIKKAKETSQKVLKIDPYNSIALKCISKWKNAQKIDLAKSTPTNAQIFLEEPGKTKVVSLIHLGSKCIIANLDAGDEVVINSHSHRVSITTLDGKYIGRLPDNLSARLRKLINMGNKYESFIKSISPTEVKVFIREKSKCPKLADIPSFSTEKIDYISFTPPELVHKKEDLMNMPEEFEKDE